MMSLSDPTWAQFQANYTNGATVAELLSRAQGGEALHRWYDDLHQELCHQYTVSEAAYPAAPYLVRLAADREDVRKELLVLLGVCHAFSEPSKLAAMPAEIVEGWRVAAAEALPLTARLLESRQANSSDLLYLLSAVAALSGYPALARAIEATDYEWE